MNEVVMSKTTETLIRLGCYNSKNAIYLMIDDCDYVQDRDIIDRLCNSLPDSYRIMAVNRSHCWQCTRILIVDTSKDRNICNSLIPEVPWTEFKKRLQDKYPHSIKVLK